MKKKSIFTLGSTLLSMLMFTACSAQSASSSSAISSQATEAQAVYHQITAEQAKKRMDENTDAIILDVRTQQEYDEKHIGGALLLPNENIKDTRPEQLPDLNAEILVYCRSGNRSRQAAEKLVALGYTAVYDFGGINSWPYETVAGDK
ncbi:rhodanese-like domain-containing protein [Hydrogenoanaerobacterium sp.]|uniref:rhodanese-like domain-containing protein n=1 Tax=Hydrogenoanaerobacterium sp. TaxID=2953763 RepID=UPI00289DAD45|nr:rhodanese-like domain-containing protein [Hydrogenoanaerobacterium sp.]